MKAAELLVRCLEHEGVTSVFGVPGEETLAKNRKYAILGAFIAAAVLTPTPDMFNQALMAGPLIILYEVGIVSARIFGKRPSVPVPASAA